MCKAFRHIVQLHHLVIAYAPGLILIAHAVNAEQCIVFHKAVAAHRAFGILQGNDLGVFLVLLADLARNGAYVLALAVDAHHGAAVRDGKAGARNAAHMGIALDQALGRAFAHRGKACAHNAAHALGVWGLHGAVAFTVFQNAGLLASGNAAHAVLLAAHLPLIGAFAQHTAGVHGGIHAFGAQRILNIVLGVQIVFKGHGPRNAARVAVCIHTGIVHAARHLGRGVGVGVAVGNIAVPGVVANAVGRAGDGGRNGVQLGGDGLHIGGHAVQRGIVRNAGIKILRGVQGRIQPVVKLIALGIGTVLQHIRRTAQAAAVPHILGQILGILAHITAAFFIGLDLFQRFVGLVDVVLHIRHLLVIGRRHIVRHLIHLAFQGVHLALHPLQGVLAVLQNGLGLHLAHNAACLLAALHGAVVFAALDIAGLIPRNTAHIVAHMLIAHGAAVHAGADNAAAGARNAAQIGDAGALFGFQQAFQRNIRKLHLVFTLLGVDGGMVGARAHNALVFTGHAAHKMGAVHHALHRTVNDQAAGLVHGGNAAHIVKARDKAHKVAAFHHARIVGGNAAHVAPATRGGGAALHRELANGAGFLHIAEHPLHAAVLGKIHGRNGMPLPLKGAAKGGNGRKGAAQRNIFVQHHGFAHAPAVQSAAAGQGFPVASAGNVNGVFVLGCLLCLRGSAFCPHGRSGRNRHRHGQQHRSGGPGKPLALSFHLRPLPSVFPAAFPCPAGLHRCFRAAAGCPCPAHPARLFPAFSGPRC